MQYSTQCIKCPNPHVAFIIYPEMHWAWKNTDIKSPILTRRPRRCRAARGSTGCAVVPPIAELRRYRRWRRRRNTASTRCLASAECQAAASPVSVDLYIATNKQTSRLTGGFVFKNYHTWCLIRSTLPSHLSIFMLLLLCFEATRNHDTISAHLIDNRNLKKRHYFWKLRYLLNVTTSPFPSC